MAPEVRIGRSSYGTKHSSIFCGSISDEEKKAFDEVDTGLVGGVVQVLLEVRQPVANVIKLFTAVIYDFSQ